MHILRRAVAVALLLAGEVAAVAVLVRLGERAPFALPLDHFASWVERTEPADALAALVRVLALALAGWLFVTTLLYLAARAANAPRALRAIEWATLPAVRRAVDGALALVAAGALLSPLGAAPLTAAPMTAASLGATSNEPTSSEPTSTVATIRDGRATSGANTGNGAPTRTTVTPTAVPPAGVPPTGVPPTAVTPAVVTPTAVTPAPATAPATTPIVTNTETVGVTAGDNLWNLAAARIAAASGRARPTLDDGEIARYWLRVCDANRASVRSGDVNLIYPGERIVLPPLA